MRDVAKRLILEEIRVGTPSDTEGRAAFRVCERLRGPLSTLAGVAGFRSLLNRAFTLAKTEVPWLARMQINASGSFEYSTEVEVQLDQEEAAQGGVALVSQLIGLLVTFIGEALTLRIIQDIWPKAAFRDSKSREEKL